MTRAIASVHADTTVLDGEVVATDAQGRPTFQVLQNRGRLPAGHQLVYYVFDLLFLDGEDLKGKRLVDRRGMLAGVVEGTRVLFSASLNGRLDAILKGVREHGLEGVIAKRLDSRYEVGRRSLAWQKLPLKTKQEFVIGGYRPEGRTLELILVGYYENGKLLFAGKVRQGLNPATRRKLLTVLKPLSSGRCPFANLPSVRSGHWGEGVTAEDMGDYTWVRPEIVAEIKFTEWTKADLLRHAEFVALRDDKDSKEVVRDISFRAFVQ